MKTIPTWGDITDPSFNKKANKEFLNSPDLYWIYRKGAKPEEWVDQWFNLPGRAYYVVTVKRCDEETQRHLYMNEYNPLTISFYYDPYYKKHHLRVVLRSVDDSSYNVLVSETEDSTIPTDTITTIREFIDSEKVINGDVLVLWLQETFGIIEVDYN